MNRASSRTRPDFLHHRVLSAEEERDACERILQAERVLVGAFLEVEETRAELVALAAELRAGTRRLGQLVRSVERPEGAEIAQRRRLLRLLRGVERVGVPGVPHRRSLAPAKLVERLVDVRLHPSVFEHLEGVLRRRGTRDAADVARLAAVTQSREAEAAAKRLLVEHNLRLVSKIAVAYQNRGLAWSDLVQEGSLGLMHAIDKYDHRRGHRLSTYATWWIKQSVDRALADYGPTIRVPVHMLDTRRKVRRAEWAHRARHGTGPTPAEIAAGSDLPVAKVANILDLPREPLSLETPFGPDDELRLGDRMIDTRHPLPDVALDHARMKEQARALFHTLGEREQLVLRLRFGLDGAAERSLEEVGRRLSLTRERVRQIERAALDRLRARCAARGYRPELES